MITAFIIANDDAKALTRTLNALIGATVEGLMREVVLLADAGNDTATKLADHAGCMLAKPAEFETLVQSAKGDWLMILEAGAFPEQGWIEALENHIQSGGGAARFTRSPLAKQSLKQRLFQRETPLAFGLLIEKRAALTLGNIALTTPQNLAKAVKPRLLLAQLRPASSARPSAA
jgi:hypothetical protein